MRYDNIMSDLSLFYERVYLMACKPLKRSLRVNLNHRRLNSIPGRGIERWYKFTYSFRKSRAGGNVIFKFPEPVRVDLQDGECVLDKVTAELERLQLYLLDDEARLSSGGRKASIESDIDGGSLVVKPHLEDLLDKFGK